MSTAVEPTTDPVAVARETAEELLDGALAADDPARGVRRETLRLLADRGLYSVAAPVADGGLGGDDRTLGAVEELLAGADGATWFVMTQHRTAQKLSAAPDGGPAAQRHRRALAGGDALAGIAVAHLRRPGSPVRAVPDGSSAGGWRFHGHSDWCTGWGLVDLVLVGARTDDDRVVFALVDARPRPGLVATEPLPLAVMGGTRTVALDLDDVAIAADEVALVVDGATWRARDAGTVLDTKPANLGLLARLLAETDRVGRERERPEAVDAAAALEAEAGPLRDRAVALRHAPDAADHADERVALRGRLAELTHRAAGGLVVARGGSAMLSRSHEQRWLREAGFHLVQAQTDAVRAAQLEAFVSRA